MRCMPTLSSTAPARRALLGRWLATPALILPLLLAACAVATQPSEDEAPPAAAAARSGLDRPARLLLLGEQHDAAEHQRLHAQTVAELAARGQLAALALEMAEQGTSTAGLAPSADEAAVRAALRWQEAAWPWAPYAPAVMAAVRAGVPVAGANLPRAQMRTAMGDATLDPLLPPEAWARQRAAIRDGHCGLLPESQHGPMARIQVARDRSMGQTLAELARQAGAGRTVVLIAGGAHVDAEVGVPRHLPPTLTRASRIWPAQPPQQDYCATLRRQLGK